MHFNQIDIAQTRDNEICISQEDVYAENGAESVYITPEMVDLVCNELQQIKSRIIKSQENG